MKIYDKYAGIFFFFFRSLTFYRTCFFQHKESPRVAPMYSTVNEVYIFSLGLFLFFKIYLNVFGNGGFDVDECEDITQSGTYQNRCCKQLRFFMSCQFIRMLKRYTYVCWK